MSVVLRTNQITGVSVVVNATDGASKGYVDTASSGGTPSITGNENEFLTTDGSTTSWQPIQGYQEYTTAGNYTFNVPTHATELFIEATGAGGGGGSGLATTSTTYVNRGEFWFLRTSGVTVALGANNNGTGPWGFYDGTNYIFGNARLVSSTDTVTWIVRTISYVLGTIYSITYGSDKSEKYVICGTDGAGDRIGSSTNSIVWVARTTGIPTSATTCSVTYGNGFYVMLSQNNGIIASTDGIVWQLRTSASSAAPYHSFYGGGYYVVGGQTNHIRVSTDTINWTLRTNSLSKAGDYINSITYGNGIYLVGCSNSSMFSTSTDTIVWVLRTTPYSGTIIYGMHYGFHNNNHVYLFSAGTTSTATSTDAIVWIARTSIITNAGSSIYANGIHLRSGGAGQISVSTVPTGNAGSGGGSGATVGSRISRSNISSSTLTVNVGSGGTAGTAGAASTVSWTSPGGNFSITANGGSPGVSTISSLTNFIPGGAGGTISTSNNYLYSFAGTAGGNGGYFESSTNNRQGLGGSDATSSTIAYQTSGGGGGASSLFDGQFGTFGGLINYGYGNTYQNSKTIPALMNGTSSLPISGLSYGNGGNGGGAQHGAVVWVLRTSGFGATAYGISYGAGIYVLAGNGGRISTSTDTITWIARTSGFGTSNVTQVISDGTTLVATGGAGTIRSSTNGIQWTVRTCPTTASLGAITNIGPESLYANGMYHVLGNSSQYLVSTDAVVWTLRTTGLTQTSQSLFAYSSDLTEKYIIHSGTTIVSSTDSISWVLRTTTGTTTTITYFGGKYQAFNGTQLLSSTNGIVWATGVTLTGQQLSSAASSTSIFVAGQSGYSYSSTDGIAWTLRTTGVGTNAFACTFGNGLFLASYGSGAQVIVADSNINGGNGGNGIRGGGGGGGGYSLVTNTAGTGGTGGDGYVRISWQ